MKNGICIVSLATLQVYPHFSRSIENIFRHTVGWYADYRWTLKYVHKCARVNPIPFQSCVNEVSTCQSNGTSEVLSQSGNYVGYDIPPTPHRHFLSIWDLIQWNQVTYQTGCLCWVSEWKWILLVDGPRSCTLFRCQVLFCCVFYWRNWSSMTERLVM